MKVSIISATLTLLAANVYGVPTSPKSEGRQFEAQITFEGADPDAYFTEPFPANGETYPITNPLSISYIESAGGATCTFFGTDGSQTTVVGAQTVPVGPPQTQVSGSCLAL